MLNKYSFIFLLGTFLTTSLGYARETSTASHGLKTSLEMNKVLLFPSALDVVKVDYGRSSKDSKPQFRPPEDSPNLARRLNQLLEGSKMVEAFRYISGDNVGGTTIFDDKDDLTQRMMRELKSDKSKLSKQQKAALALFYFGLPTRVDVLFGEKESRTKENQELLDDLVKSGILNLSTNELGAMANYSIHTHQLPNKQNIFMLTDLPRQVEIGPDAPTAQVSRTSLYLLHRIEKDFIDGKKISGIAADFGSGTGLQALAIAKLHAGVDKVIGLEIDPQSMKLAEFNAQLNGVGDRFITIDNGETQNLTKELAGRKISYAVSNPPFNLVPNELEKDFDVFGFGGDDGLLVTQIFIDQVKDHLATDGEFLFYSVLGQKRESESFLVEDNLTKAIPRGAMITAETGFLPDHAFSKEGYARGFSEFMVDNSKGERKLNFHSVEMAFLKAFEQKGIDRMVPAFIRLSRAGVVSETPTSVERKTYEMPGNIDRWNRKRAQAAEQDEGALMTGPAIRGGVFLQLKQGGVERFMQLKEQLGGEKIEKRHLDLQSIWNQTCKEFPLLDRVRELMEDVTPPKSQPQTP